MKLFSAAVLCLFASLARAQNPNVSVYPSIPTDNDLLVANNFYTTNLTAPVTAGASALPVGSTAGLRLPTAVVIDSTLPTREIIKVCSRTATTLNVCINGRGFDLTTARSHAYGANVAAQPVAWLFNQAFAEIQSLSVHGGGGGGGGGGGSAGSTILSGAGAPGSGLGSNGDFYLDKSATCLYGPKTSGQWPDNCTSLIGPAGANGSPGVNGINGVNGTNGVNGNTILSGTSSPPSSGTGANGDFYLNTAAECLYGPKASGAWPGSCTSLAGPAGTSGTNGNTLLNGTSSPPSNGTGVNGDFYLNTAAECLYGPKASGAWPGSCTSLIGPGGSMVYPGAGVPVSTGTAWGTSLAVQGTDTKVMTAGTISGGAGTGVCLDSLGGVTTSGCTSSGATIVAGAFTSGDSAGSCTLVLTTTSFTAVGCSNSSLVGAVQSGSATATNGWACTVHDLSHPENAWGQSATSTTSLTLIAPGISTSGDTVNFTCAAY